MSEIFMTRDETARTLRLSLRTVDSLIGRGELAVRRVGRRVLIPTDEVKRFAGELNLAPAISTATEAVKVLAPAAAVAQR
jgi:excisionase family DNA binding protein